MALWSVGDFRDLDVYRRSVALAARLRRLVGTWHNLDLWTCGIQMIRAADSIGANLAEAHGRDTYRDRRRHLYVARGSAFELEPWLETAVARGLAINDATVEEAHQLSRMLNGLARRWSRDPEA